MEEGGVQSGCYGRSSGLEQTLLAALRCRLIETSFSDTRGSYSPVAGPLYDLLRHIA